MDKVTKQYQVPSSVFFREVSGEAVLLNMDNEGYFGLDDTAVDMWKAVTESDDLQGALDILLAEYDVDADVLQPDLVAFIAELESRGLLIPSGA